MIKSIYQSAPNKNAQWRKGTTLIAGDSLLYGLDEKRLRNAKVRMFPGCTIEDLEFHIIPLLRRCPSNIIIHIGAKNAKNDTSAVIIQKLKKLKANILQMLPSCNIIFFELIIRCDDEKAQLTTTKTNKLLPTLDTPFIVNSNINDSNLGLKGLHMKPSGIGKLALNIAKFLKKL